MINNQQGRRNLNDAWKIELALAKKEMLQRVGRERKIKAGQEYGRGAEKLLSFIDKSYSEPSHNTRQEIASSLSMSTGKVAQAEIQSTVVIYSM